METGKANDAKPDLEKDAASPEVMVGAAVNLSTKKNGIRTSWSHMKVTNLKKRGPLQTLAHDLNI